MATIVQTATAHIVPAGTTRTLTFPNAVTAGNTIIAVITAYDSANAVTWSVTDNKNGATVYSVADYVSAVITGAETENAGIVYLENTAGSTGANSFIVSIAFTHGDAANASVCSILEVSGLKTSGSIDRHNHNSQVSSTTSANVANTLANQASSGLSVATMVLYAGSTTEGISLTGYTNVDVIQDGNSANPSSVDYKILSATETTSVTYTHSHTLQTGWVAALATFQNAGAAVAPVKSVDTSQPIRRTVVQDFSAPNYQTRQAVTAPLLPLDTSEPLWRPLIRDAPSTNTLKASAVIPPVTTGDLDSRISVRGIYSDFIASNFTIFSLPNPGPFVGPDAPDSPYSFRRLQDFTAPNFILNSAIPVKPIAALDLSQTLKSRWVPDAPPSNLLTPPLLKLPPFTQEDLPAWSLRARGVYTDFTAPNLAGFLPVVTNPLYPVDLSQQVKARIAGSDFTPANLLTGLLPLPPLAPAESAISIRAKGVFTDFSPPNLSLSSLAPPVKPLSPQDSFLRLEYRWLRGDDLPINLLPLRQTVVTPIAPQDLSGMRIGPKALGTEFSPPNLTLFLPVPPPVPPATDAGRHGTRAQARRRRQLNVLRAKMDAFRERRLEADRALIAAEDGEIKARAKLLKRIRVKPLTKDIEQYAPVRRAIEKRTVIANQHRSILEQIRWHQLEAERIEREIAAETRAREDEEAAVHLMQYLMMESWA